MDVVCTNTVKLSAKRIEGDVAIACSASESRKSRNERRKKYSYALLLFLPSFFRSCMCEQMGSEEKKS
jgi:hypothetical protein